MKIDFGTGRVYYTDVLNENPEEIKKSIEEMKIQDTDEEPVFSKTIHQNLKYGRLKYICYCFLLVLDGLIGVISLGQTQSIMAQKYLLSKWIMEGYDDRQNSR